MEAVVAKAAGRRLSARSKARAGGAYLSGPTSQPCAFIEIRI